MPELSPEFRARAEAEIAALIERTHGKRRQQLIDSMGWPPRITDETLKLLDEIREELKGEQMAALLLLVILAGADNMRAQFEWELDEADMAQRARDLAQQQADRIAEQMTDTTLERLQEAAQTAQEEITRGHVEQIPDAEDAARTDFEKRVESTTSEERGKGAAKGETTNANTEGEKAAKESAAGQVPAGMELVAFWRHASHKEPGHAGASVRPCPVCTPLLDTPEWEWEIINAAAVNGPGLHPHCLLPGTLVAATGTLAAMAVRYDGPAVRLVMSEGRTLTVTPHHDLLTGRGFAAANEIANGDYLIRCPDVLAAVGPDDHNQPSAIEKIVRSFAESSGVVASAMPATSEDFNGDGQFGNGNIYVVNSDRTLGHTPKPSPFQVGHHIPFCFSLTSISFDRMRPFEKLLFGLAAAAHGLVGSSSLAQSLFRGHLGCAELSGITLTSRGVSSVNHRLAQYWAAYANALRCLQERFPALVSFDKVVDVRHIHFRGHVYDLQTETGLLLANGYYSSNCDCYLRYELIPVEQANELRRRVGILNG